MIRCYYLMPENVLSGEIKGSDGAAELLGVKANTLIARIKKMGFKRPLERMQETSSRA